VFLSLLCDVPQHLHSFPTRRSSDLNEVKHYGSQALFDQLLTDYRATSDGGYQRDIMAALTKTSDKALLEQIVSHFEDSETIKPRSEEHTSELQSRFDLVCRLLLEKK